MLDRFHLPFPSVGRLILGPLAFLLTVYVLPIFVVAQEIDPALLDEAARRTGMSREELIRQYQQRQGNTSQAAVDTNLSEEPGRTSLEGIDDTLVPATADSRWRDTDTVVDLPGSGMLEADQLEMLDADELKTVPGDSVGYFGHDFFRLDEGVFNPPTFGAISPNYRLGVGDEIVINVWGGIDFQLTRIVDRDGSILLPRLGKVICAGRTLTEVDQSIREILALSHDSIDADGEPGGDDGDTFVEVTVGRLRAIRVFVVGAVTMPGSFELTSAARVLTALYAAGGPVLTGSLRDVRLVRNNQQIVSIDLYQYLLGNGLEGDVQLQEGDTIYVPDIGPSVRVAGEVRRPMYYEMKTGETLYDLFRYCGGFTSLAAPEVVHIERILPPGARAAGQPDLIYLDVAYNVVSMKPVEGQAMEILDGDRVTIASITDRLENWVEVKGHVKRPGQYQFTPGMTVASLLSLAGGIWPDALTERAVLDRTSERLELSALNIPLQRILDGQAADVPLQARDVLHIFSRWAVQERPQVYISGEVYTPLNEDYREGMTVRDLVLKAGGLKQGADLMRAEIARTRLDAMTSREKDDRPNQTVDVITFELTSEFLTREDSLELQPWDRVFIRRLPWWEMQRTVVVRGEIFYPGTFSLERQDERLSSIITRAGGLKPDAYLIGARVIRKQDGVGNIAIDLTRALAEPGSQYDIILQEGDEILVPDSMFTVKIIGEVGFPTSMIWEAGEDINYYVERAGGYLEKADKGKTRVVWPNGLSLPNKGGSEVVAGSTIIVPMEPPPEGRTTLEVMRDITGIMAGLATVWLIVQNTN